MLRAALTAIAVLLAGAASGQGLEPGEWEFTSTTSSPALPKPHSATVKQCVKQEDAANPERWLGQQKQKTDCKFTHGKKGADTVTWEMSCPKSNMRGYGSARTGRGTMESEMHMSGEMQGRKFEMQTKMSGRRLGPCKS
ncbi:MAG: DUF3617 domain-containing protein [Burkholderiales bacterium]